MIIINIILIKIIIIIIIIFIIINIIIINIIIIIITWSTGECLLDSSEAIYPPDCPMNYLWCFFTL